MSSLTAARTRTLAAGACLTATLVLAGCGAGGTTSAPTDPGGGSSQGGGRGQGGARQPGVSGLIAAVSGKTLQVQGTSGQTAVTYTAKTTFTEVASASAKALKTGLCATVRSPEGASASAAEAVTAGSVTLSDAVGGRCDNGFGGGNRPSGAPTGAPSGMPSGGPSDRPSGGPSGMPGGGRFGMGAMGLVSSVDGTTFVVQSTRMGGSGQATKITVTTTDATTWQQVATSTSKSVAVGACALATGKTSDTGALTATTLRLSKATNGTCATGRAGGQPGQPGAPSAPAGTVPSSSGQSSGQGNG